MNKKKSFSEPASVWRIRSPLWCRLFGRQWRPHVQTFNLRGELIRGDVSLDESGITIRYSKPVTGFVHYG